MTTAPTDLTGNSTGSGVLDPDLGALTGSSAGQVYPLDATSLAINAGNPSGCIDYTGAVLTEDQRGSIRPNGAACDIGAYEL